MRQGCSSDDDQADDRAWKERVCEIEDLLSFDESLRTAQHLVTSRHFAEAARTVLALEARVTSLRCSGIDSDAADVSKNMRIELRLLRENLLLTLSEQWSEQVRWFVATTSSTAAGARTYLHVSRDAELLSSLATAMLALDALPVALRTLATKVHQHFVLQLYTASTTNHCLEVASESNETRHSCSLVTSSRAPADVEQVLASVQHLLTFLHHSFDCARLALTSSTSAPSSTTSSSVVALLGNELLPLLCTATRNFVTDHGSTFNLEPARWLTLLSHLRALCACALKLGFASSNSLRAQLASLSAFVACRSLLPVASHFLSESLLHTMRVSTASTLGSLQTSDDVISMIASVNEASGGGSLRMPNCGVR